jgi:hypothetical protein
VKCIGLKAASEVATASRVMLAEGAGVIYRRVRRAALSKEGRMQAEADV